MTTIDGGDGEDQLDGGAAPDTVNGGAGNDVIHGGSGADTINAGPGDDIVYSDSGPDRIDAGDGNDTVYANNGTAVETVDCGRGEDTIYINPYDRKGGISNAQALRGGRIRNCEHVIEQEPVHDATKGVTRDANSRHGGTLHGTERNDNLLGGPGYDHLFGGAGDDVLWGNRLHDGRSFDTDYLDAGHGNDTVYGSRANNTIIGGDGDDFLHGGPKPNRIIAGTGNDTVRLRGAGPNTGLGSAADDTIEAYAKGQAAIDCGPGDDRVNIGFNRLVRTRTARRSNTATRSADEVRGDSRPPMPRVSVSAPPTAAGQQEAGG